MVAWCPRLMQRGLGSLSQWCTASSHFTTASLCNANFVPNYHSNLRITCNYWSPSLIFCSTLFWGNNCHRVLSEAPVAVGVFFSFSSFIFIDSPTPVVLDEETPNREFGLFPWMLHWIQIRAHSRPFQNSLILHFQPFWGSLSCLFCAIILLEDPWGAF